MILPWPILTPGNTTTPVPNQTLSSMKTSLLSPLVLILLEVSGKDKSWPFPSIIWQLAAIKQFLPMVTLEYAWIQLP